MSRRIEHSATYSASPAALHAALTDEDYWRARVASVGGPGATLDAVEAAAGGITVGLTQAIAEQHLPSIVRKLKAGDLIIARTETWGSLEGSSASGMFTARVAGTPITMRGTHVLSGDATSCTSRTTGDALVAVPLVGGRIEDIIAGNATALLALEQRFTEQWLAEH